jgi:hypothetical protein
MDNNRHNSGTQLRKFSDSCIKSLHCIALEGERLTDCFLDSDTLPNCFPWGNLGPCVPVFHFASNVPCYRPLTNFIQTETFFFIEVAT